MNVCADKRRKRYGNYYADAAGYAAYDLYGKVGGAEKLVGLQADRV